MYYLLITILISNVSVNEPNNSFHEQTVKTFRYEYPSLTECLREKYINELELSKRVDVDIASFETSCNKS